MRECRHWTVLATLLLIVCSTATAQTAKPVELLFMSWTGFYGIGDADEAVVRRFNEKHPNINVSFESPAGSQALLEKITLMVAGGVAPDIAQLRFSGPPSYDKLALDIRGFIARDEFDMSWFFPAMIDLVQKNGSIYGLPADWGSMLLYYNQSMFQDAGLLEPEYGWTTRDFRRVARKLTLDTDGDGNNDQFGASIHCGHLYLWGQLFGGKFIDEKIKKLVVTEPEFIEALQWLQKLFIEDGVIGGNPKTGTSAMWAEWDAFLSRYICEGWHQFFDWNTGYMPRGGNAPVFTYSQGHSLSIIKSSRHPEAAWEFMKFYYSHEADEIRARYGMGLIRIGQAATSWVNQTRVPPGYDREKLFEPVMNPPELRTIPWQIDGSADVLKKLIQVLENDIITGKESPRTAVEAVVPTLEGFIQ